MVSRPLPDAVRHGPPPLRLLPPGTHQGPRGPHLSCARLTNVTPYGITAHMVDRRRERALNVRMLDAETEMLANLAEHEGVSVSEWIRNVVRTQYTLAFGSSKPKPS